MEINKHTPGTFCWADLGTTDQTAAKKFYSELFGLGFDDKPMGPDSFYSMVLLNGKQVGAIYQQDKQTQEQGIPPYWLSYIAVESADKTAQAITAAGGKLLMEPFDVFDAGRMAIAQDPTGAVFGIWQPNQHQGAQLKDETGTICWNELVTSDIPTAKTFYGKAFGWTAVTKDDSPMPYTEWYIGEPAKANVVGGMYKKVEEWGNIPPHWMIYFAVDDCDASVKKAQSLSAGVIVPPTDIPEVGRFAVIQDPQGAVFSVIKLNLRH